MYKIGQFTPPIGLFEIFLMIFQPKLGDSPRILGV